MKAGVYRRLIRHCDASLESRFRQRRCNHFSLRLVDDWRRSRYREWKGIAVGRREPSLARRLASKG